MMDKTLFYNVFILMLIVVCGAYKPNSIAKGSLYGEFEDSTVAEESELSAEGFEKPVPYNFMYNHQDTFGNVQHREENKNEDGVVRGSYGYRDPLGMYRHVSYVADANGFHAVLRTNEPGIENKNSADVAVVAQVPARYKVSRQDSSESDEDR
ncbi:uncharacterized protein CDAR_539971 [Caerostris darwini]|uniref:Uncharacterized protein n=1 Tax=Caerostris darwini TaxID=1538125 RepID=A0AAV4TH87_9ARAC|nr:uncharacterized protein CDAR_539971 [Caerostris darwini]